MRMIRATNESLPTNCSLVDVRAILRDRLDELWAHPEDARDIAPLLIWGAPGIGKSETVRDLCAELGIGLCDVRLSQMESIDLRGLPVPRGGVVQWLPASMWPRDPESRGILFLDELSAAERSLQVAAYELILDRRIGDGYEVPRGWYIAAAGNRAGDQAVCVPMSSALANRFCHLEVEPDLDAWLRWAESRGLCWMVRAFLRFRPQAFLAMEGDLGRGWPSPRSWARVARACERREAKGERAFRAEVLGLVGVAAAREFLAFLERHAELPDAAGMLAGERPIEIPAGYELRLTFCEGVAAHLWSVLDRAKALDRFFEILAGLPNDLAMKLLNDVTEGRPPDDVAAVYMHEGCRRWAGQGVQQTLAPLVDSAERLCQEVAAILDREAP